MTLTDKAIRAAKHGEKPVHSSSILGPASKPVADTDLDLDAGFIRARRNLILIRLALLAALHYGLTLEKINILGNESALPKAQSVAGILWWFWAYLLWRYWTAFSEVRDKRFLDTYTQERWRLTNNRAGQWWAERNPTVTKKSFISANPSAEKELGRSFRVITVAHRTPDGVGGQDAVREDWCVPGGFGPRITFALLYTSPSARR